MSYLDCNATTPVDARVIERVAECLGEVGNAASVHRAGRRARERLERARAAVAEVVDRPPESVYFTSGATEADNLALCGLRDFAE